MPESSGVATGARRQRSAVVHRIAALVPALLLFLYLVTQYAGGWRTSFVNEDWSFLDLARGRSLFALLTDPALYVGPWLRPWSQGFHYWALESVFGMHVLPWHIVSALIALITLALYFEFVRRNAGMRDAAVAAACAAALAGWALPMVWIAGVQDLWMLAFALATMSLWSRDRRGWAAVTLALALLSRETAAVLPALLVVMDVLLAGRTLRQAIARSWMLWCTLVLWAAIHPAFGGRVWHHQAPVADTTPHMTALEAGRYALLAIANVDIFPAPEAGWLGVLGPAVTGALILLALCAWCARSSGDRDRPAPGQLAVFGAAWAIIGWMPLLLPSLHWHSYYSLFGSLGAWLALSALFARRPAIVVAVVLGLCVLREARTTTPIEDWGEPYYVRRAGELTDTVRARLLAKCPSPSPSTRFYFTDVPAGAGFLVGDGPALRVWYSDRTLEGRFYRDFALRAPGAPPGPDRFLRYDVARGWIEIVPGQENVEEARRENGSWLADHERLARVLTEARDWRASYEEYAKLAEAVPDSLSFAYMAGLGAITAGDSVVARHWLARVAADPRADAEMRSVARAYAPPLSPLSR